jgi:hypothetical protein
LGSPLLDSRAAGKRDKPLFLSLADPGRAQRLADRFATLPWPAILDRLARVNPLLRDLLASYRYYWAAHQAEYATDVLFTNRVALRGLYPRLLRHATLCLRAEDVLTFLGRKLHGKFAGEMDEHECLARLVGRLERSTAARIRAAQRSSEFRDASSVDSLPAHVRPAVGAGDDGLNGHRMRKVLLRIQVIQGVVEDVRTGPIVLREIDPYD